MVAKRFAILMAVAGGAMAVVANWRVGRVITGAAAIVPTGRPITILPLSLCALVILCVLRAPHSVVFAPLGALMTFVVGAAMSIGLYYAPAALFLTLAATLCVLEGRSWWRVIAAPFWFLFGASTIPAGILVTNYFWHHEAAQIDYSPVLSFSAKITAFSLTSLIVLHLIRRVINAHRSSAS